MQTFKNYFFFFWGEGLFTALQVKDILEDWTIIILYSTTGVDRYMRTTGDFKKQATCN